MVILTGKVGITLNTEWHEPKDASSPPDIEASEAMMQVKLGWFAQPIFGDGDYPDVFKMVVAGLAQAFGAPQSPLPEFTSEEKSNNKG